MLHYRILFLNSRGVVVEVGVAARPDGTVVRVQEADGGDNWWIVIDLVRKGYAERVGEDFRLRLDNCPQPVGVYDPF